MIPQFRTEEVMRERLAELGYQVEFGCELIDFEQEAGGVVSRLRWGAREEVVYLCYLVGADGDRNSRSADWSHQACKTIRTESRWPTLSRRDELSAIFFKTSRSRSGAGGLPELAGWGAAYARSRQEGRGSDLHPAFNARSNFSAKSPETKTRSASRKEADSSAPNAVSKLRCAASQSRVASASLARPVGVS